MRIRHSLVSLTAVTAALAACDGRLAVEEEPEPSAGAGGTSGSAPAGHAGQVSQGTGGTDGVKTEWSGNSAACPGLPPATLESCSVTEGEFCAYQTETSFGFEQSICACWRAKGGERLWSCSVSSAPWECPATQPSEGDDCFGLFGAQCMYPPRATCACDADTESWRCSSGDRDDIPAVPAEPAATKPVSELSAVERTAWCDWFVTARLGEGYPPDPAPPVDANGYTYDNGCTLGGGVVCSAAVPTISRAMCETNLSLSSCEAPIAELTDCVTTVYQGCWPSPRGCAPYLERAGCNGTIVLDTSQSPENGSGGTGGSSPGGTAGGKGAICSIKVQ